MADITHLITISVSPQTIFPLVATAEGLSKWWAEDVTSTPDGSAQLGFFNRATIYLLRPQTQLAPSRATWVVETGKEWAGTRLTFELMAGEKGTSLRFSHADWKAVTDYFTSCNTTWGGLLFWLRAAAEGRNPGPLFRRNSMSY